MRKFAYPFLLLLFVCSILLKVEGKPDSLLQVLNEQILKDNWEGQMITHYELGADLLLKEDYETAEHHFLQALLIAQKHNNQVKVTDNIYGLGVSHRRRNNFPKALEYFYQVIEMADESTQMAKKGKAYSQISSIYQTLGDYEKAFEMQMQALQLREIANDSLGIADSYYVIGTIFFYQKRLEQSLEFYEKSKVICDALKEDRTIYSCLAALGSIHTDMGNYETGLHYNERSLALAEKLNYKTGIAYALGNIASNNIKSGKLEQAERYAKKSIEIKRELSDKWGVIGAHLILASVYEQMERPKDALPLLHDALDKAIELKSKPRQLEIYQQLASIYKNINKPDEAYHYLTTCMALKDSLLNEKTVEEMGQSKKRYEIEKREHEIVLLKKENELLGKNEKIQKLQFYVFLTLGLLFLSFSWWFLNRYKLQQRMNKLLEDKNQILNSKNEEIHFKNKLLEHSNENLKQFTYVASHDLKEPLRMINAYTNLLKKRYDHLYDDNGREFMHFVIDGVSRMQTLLEDLLNYSKVGNSQKPVQWVDVSDVMIMAEANLRHLFEELNGQLIVHKENLPAIKAHRTQLLQLLQNLVSNGVKFRGDQDPVITIDCQQKEGNYIFSIQDNGIGISAENQHKIFDMFRRLHTKDEYEGSGIGLATCKRIVDLMDGEIWVESVLGQGSTFFFSIPCLAEESVLT